MRWLESGTRRDICVLLYGAGTVRVQTLKRQLEERYDDRLDPKPFRDRLEALTRAGHLRREPDGIHDGYRLTDRGEAAVEAHYEWLRERVEGGTDGESGGPE
jgi:DNA-binding HxlR family transcriptional regulator